MKKLITCILAPMLAVTLGACNCSIAGRKDEVNKVRALIIPKFELGEMTGDAVGESQLFYEKYFAGLEEYPIENLPEYAHFYYNKDTQLAMLVAHQGKTASSISMTTALSDRHFDYSDAVIVSIGCAGGSVDYTTMGDVCLATLVCDGELGHIAHSSDLKEGNVIRWFHDSNYDATSHKVYNRELVEKAYELVKDVPLRTTELTLNTLQEFFPENENFKRNPKVLLGSFVSQDNFWKGTNDHKKAKYICRTYEGKEPYAMTEQEEISVANVAEAFGMLDRLIAVRVSVNIDVFFGDDHPEDIWSNREASDAMLITSNEETLDIFEPAMYNLFDVSSVLVDAILDGSLN